MESNVESNIADTLKLPRWAVVGASPNPERYSHQIMTLLRERGYTVLPVRPGRDEIDGLPCYATLSDIPEPPDVVDMVVNPSIGLGVMEEVKRLGIKHVWLQPGSESPEILEFARANGIAAYEACVLVALRTRPGLGPEAA